MLNIGSFVRVKKTVLNKEERAKNIPNDTSEFPLEMWTKGFLLEDSEIGKIGKIKTLSGRFDEGIIESVNHSYKHSFGDFIPEILDIDQIVLGELYGDDYE